MGDISSNKPTSLQPLNTNTSTKDGIPPHTQAAGAGAINTNPQAYPTVTLDGGNPMDFSGTVSTDDTLPSDATLSQIGDYALLDKDSKTLPFRALYTGRHVARRVLVVFIRHFYCGHCQDYVRALARSVPPDALLRLPISTFVAVVGCGDPALIPVYADATGCPFPIYADPTRKLYEALGMVRTLAAGAQPAYVRRGLLKSAAGSVLQAVRQVGSGLATKGGDSRQVGGEFLFEPMSLLSPVPTPNWSEAHRLGHSPVGTPGAGGEGLDGGEDGLVEEKRVTWCHRMRTTRDHAEIPELMEVLGLDGTGQPLATGDKDVEKRWERALEERKGTGLSMAKQMSTMRAANGFGLAPSPPLARE